MTDEMFPIVNSDGEVTGCATRRECHGGSKLLHPVVHLHLVTSDGRIYLQKRVLTKDIQPGKWDTAVGGHVDYGEKVADALVREAREELGYNVTDPVKIFSYVFESERERELINVFAERVPSDIRLTPSPDEVDEGRFWTFDEVEAAIGCGVLTPNFESEFCKIKSLIAAI